MSVIARNGNMTRLESPERPPRARPRPTSGGDISRLSSFVRRAAPVLRRVAPLAIAAFAPQALPLVQAFTRQQSGAAEPESPQGYFPAPLKVQMASHGIWSIARGAAMGAVEDIPLLGGAIRGGRAAYAASEAEDIEADDQGDEGDEGDEEEEE
jgi:hypothetical protein